jgi:uncharacterized protein (DUF58 family)
MVADPVRYDPALLARVESLDWRSRVLVEGFLQGRHRSVRRGFSAEFAQHHPYIQGDDPRHLDWRAYARFDRLYIREYEAETNLRLHVVVDASASMDYGSPAAPWRKCDHAGLLAASLLRLFRSANDAAGVSIVSQGTLAAHLPARLGPMHHRRCTAALEAMRPAGEGSVGDGLVKLGDLIGRRSAVVVLSDAFEDVDRLGAGLRRLRYDHHDCLLLQILDPRELRFDLTASGLLEDPETGQRVPVVPDWNRPQYLAALRAHLDAVEGVCRDLGVQYRLVPTDESPFHALADALAARGRGRG